MQHCLLSKSKLSFEKAYELAQAMEISMADHDTRELKGLPTTAVNKLNKSNSVATRNFPLPIQSKQTTGTHEVIVIAAAGNILQLNVNFDN